MSQYNKYTKVLDIAALGQELSPIELRQDIHIVELDDIEISVVLFKKIFYPYDGNCFSVNVEACRDPFLVPYISFLYRTVDGVPFNLLQTIFCFLESDLHISRDCFELCCKLDLEKELSCIKTICDVNICAILCALKWDEVIKVLKSKDALLEELDPDGNIIYHILKISIIFKNPNPDTKDVMIKFRYKVYGILV
jgi:hypothetical protein